MPNSKLTTNSGMPIAQNQHSLTAGERGPVLIQDIQLLEKLAHFNREKIPERIVHAKGYGAHGVFTVTHDISNYTRAKIFESVGKETRVFARFSTVAGEKGTADTERDPRGFALKFYTEEGVWDLVGNNTPVFFERDPLKFPDFLHSQKRDPVKGYKDPRRMWEYWAKSPANMHQITILFSDRGIPDGFRHMNGYGSHTYSFWNYKNERYWVKFHFKTEQGIKNILPEKAIELAGSDPDYAGRDLHEAIEHKNFPKWNLQIQIINEDEAQDMKINPFDLTKIWPHTDYPLIDVGFLELNQNPSNYFKEVEQSAFSPSHLVPGIAASPDKMLQARLFAYPDAQRYRLGVNYQELDINKSISEVRNYQQDGFMNNTRVDERDNFEPNDFNGPTQVSSFEEPPLKVNGNIARYDSHKDNDDYTQAGDLYRLLPEDEKDRLTSNIVSCMNNLDKETKELMIVHFTKCDKDYGYSVYKKLNIY